MWKSFSSPDAGSRAAQLRRRSLAVAAIGALLLTAAPLSASAAQFTVCPRAFNLPGAGTCGETHVTGDAVGELLSTTVVPGVPTAFSNGVGGAAAIAGAGPGGIAGTASASVGYGELHANAFANNGEFDFKSADRKAFVNSEARVSFRDEMTNDSDATLNLRGTFSVNGSFAGTSAGEGFFVVTRLSSFEILTSRTLFVAGIAPSAQYQIEFSLAPGDAIHFYSTLDAHATSSNGEFSVVKTSAADLSHTARVFFDVLTPGGKVTTLSGHDYSTGATAVVPEPGTWALLLAGFALMGGALRRRRGAVAIGRVGI